MCKDSVIEAFVELNTQIAPLAPASYRAGYRHSESGEVICAVEIAASIVESAVLQHSKLGMFASADGHVESSINTTTADCSINGRPFVAEPIDSLVARLLDNENLRMEEVTAVDLATLLQRLHRSVALVKEALDRISDAPKSSS